MAENILVAACESETRKAAKRMRLEIDLQSSQDEPVALDKQHSRDSAAISHSTYSLPASSFSQDPVYAKGSLNYSYHGYWALSSNLQPPASLQTGNHKWAHGPQHERRGLDHLHHPHAHPLQHQHQQASAHRSAQPHGHQRRAQQLIAGYRESAAFLLRSADELENLILQQN
ncbi:Nucleolar protein 4-like [Saguinus oedipus]|uniref:Nucleolar protein 4-like n=1 Tax=Saguinus oedipus TaxID=9490 RepID=A0ABQ9UM28_SAGOE|nr:Nucleolar protein 4-like [Saguinus oedipus]